MSYTVVDVTGDRSTFDALKNSITQEHGMLGP